MLGEQFGDKWLENTPPDSDPFRRIYIHGWPFALKAIALAYHRSRIDELGPLSKAIGAVDTSKTVEEAFKAKAVHEKLNWKTPPTLSVAELKQRLTQIKWERYRQHWIALTGAKIKDGTPAGHHSRAPVAL